MADKLRGKVAEKRMRFLTSRTWTYHPQLKRGRETVGKKTERN